MKQEYKKNNEIKNKTKSPHLTFYENCTLTRKKTAI